MPRKSMLALAAGLLAVVGLAPVAASGCVSTFTATVQNASKNPTASSIGTPISGLSTTGAQGAVVRGEYWASDSCGSTGAAGKIAFSDNGLPSNWNSHDPIPGGLAAGVNTQVGVFWQVVPRGAVNDVVSLTPKLNDPPAVPAVNGSPLQVTVTSNTHTPDLGPAPLANAASCATGPIAYVENVTNNDTGTPYDTGVTLPKNTSLRGEIWGCAPAGHYTVGVHFETPTSTINTDWATLAFENLNTTVSFKLPFYQTLPREAATFSFCPLIGPATIGNRTYDGGVTEGVAVKYDGTITPDCFIVTSTG